MGTEKQAALEVTRVKKLELEKSFSSRYRDSEIFGETQHYIYCGDSARMTKIKNESIDLVVTSPPYFNAKEYSQWPHIDDYLRDMEKIFKEIYRKLKPGRKLCLNISDLPTKGDFGVLWQPLGPLLLLRLNKIGFELSDRIFWFKTPLKGFQYGSLPFPPSPLINDSVEYIYILRKPGKADYKYLDKQKKAASKLLREEYVEYTKQIWSMRRVRLSQNIDGHIAPFPEELAKRCIMLYSFVGDTVLDPFGGSGTVTKVAADLKRNSIMYELNPDYIQITKQRLELSNASIFIKPSFLYE